MDSKIVLSIVIPTKNRAELLGSALESIERQKADRNNFEVIVVDNGSTDSTEEVVREYQKKSENYRYFYDNRPGLHVGRNRGILESRGELVGYLDDDVILFPNWINTVLKAFEDKEVMYVGGSVIPYNLSLLTSDFKAKNETRKGSFRYIYSISCFWESGITENDTRIHRMPEGGFFGGNSVYRKSILLACGGFHPDGMPNHLLMYRGDGEAYVERYIIDSRKKAMYYAQASVYHLVDTNRVSDTYINYMYFRIGISSMYTYLREKGVKGGIVRISRMIKYIVCKREISYVIKGEIYLLLYYIFYGRVRRWVHKKDYF